MGFSNFVRECREKEVFKMSVTNALGCGQQKGYHESYRGVDVEVNLLKKVRIEIAVNEDFVEATIEGIVQGARTGRIGDGKTRPCPTRREDIPRLVSTNGGRMTHCPPWAYRSARTATRRSSRIACAPTAATTAAVRSCPRPTTERPGAGDEHRMDGGSGTVRDASLATARPKM